MKSECILLAGSGGFLMGIAIIAFKIFLTLGFFPIYHIFILLGAAVLGGTGFFIIQKALSIGTVHVVNSASAAILTIIPVVGGILVFDEGYSLTKIFSIAIILSGVLLVSRR